MARRRDLPRDYRGRPSQAAAYLRRLQAQGGLPAAANGSRLTAAQRQSLFASINAYGDRTGGKYGTDAYAAARRSFRRYINTHGSGNAGRAHAYASAIVNGVRPASAQEKRAASRYLAAMGDS